MTTRIHIVGIGDDGLDGLTGHAKSLVDTAEILVGSTTLIDRISSEVTAERVTCDGGLDALESCIDGLPEKPTVLLASGDP